MVCLGKVQVIPVFIKGEEGRGRLGLLLRLPLELLGLDRDSLEIGV